MRENLPSGREGLVLEDLDLVVLHYGRLIGRPHSADGRFMLVEIKTKYGKVGYAQQRVYKLIHKLLRYADPNHQYYGGYHVLHWDPPQFKLDNYPITEQQMKDFLMGRIYIVSPLDSAESLPEELIRRRVELHEDPYQHTRLR